MQASLIEEQARSAALRSQLDQIVAGSAEVSSALRVARDQIATDVAQAGKLRASLTAAKTKLAALERSIRQARATGRPSPARTASAPATMWSTGDDHGETDDD